MKILLIGPKWVGGWLEGVERVLPGLGCTPMKFYYDGPSAPSVAGNTSRVFGYTPSFLHSRLMPIAVGAGRAWENRMNKRIVDVGRSFRPDLVLILKGETVQEETLAALQSPGRCIASWWLDDPNHYTVHYPQVHSQMRYLDALFIFDRGVMGQLAQSGARQMMYLPCAFDPDVYHPKEIRAAALKRYRCDIGFAATYYPERGRLLGAMKGLKVGIWGSGWKSTPELKALPKGTLRGRYLRGAEVASMYGVASICPNVHHSQTLDGGLNMRTFEIPAAGGFQLVDNVPGLDEHFELKREIVAYESPEHCRDLADYYLKHPSKREEITERGRQRVMRDHTYLQRMKIVLDAMKRKI